MGVFLLAVISLISGIVCSRAAAPLTTPASSPSTAAALWPTDLALIRWRRPHESEVDVNRLVKKLGAVEGLDGCSGFREGGIFDQSVSLYQ